MAQLGLVHARLGVRKQPDLFSEGDRAIALHFTHNYSFSSKSHYVLDMDTFSQQGYISNKTKNYRIIQ